MHGAKTINTQDEYSGLRALKSSTAVALAITTLLFATGNTGIGRGFVVGAMLSLFSLFTLAALVPMLFQPGGNPHAKFLIGVTLFMKLPIYAAGLFLVTRIPIFAPLGAFAGIMLVPATLTLKAMRSQVNETGRLSTLADPRFHELAGGDSVERASAPSVAGLVPAPKRG